MPPVAGLRRASCRFSCLPAFRSVIAHHGTWIHAACTDRGNKEREQRGGGYPERHTPIDAPVIGANPEQQRFEHPSDREGHSYADRHTCEREAESRTCAASPQRAVGTSNCMIDP